MMEWHRARPPGPRTLWWTLTDASRAVRAGAAGRERWLPRPDEVQHLMANTMVQVGADNASRCLPLYSPDPAGAA
jgi:hypothetical protein